jgi:hypothetical protein
MLHRARRLRLKHELGLGQGLEQGDKTLRHKHELELERERERGDGSLRFKHKAGQGDDERVTGKRSVGGLWNDGSGRAHDEARDGLPGPSLTGHVTVKEDTREDAGDFGAFGVLPGPLPTGIPDERNEEKKEEAGDFGAFGVLPGPVLTGSPQVAREDMQEEGGDLGAHGVIHGRPRSRPREASAESSERVSGYAASHPGSTQRAPRQSLGDRFDLVC